MSITKSCIALAVMTWIGFAQTEKPKEPAGAAPEERFYRLDFQVKEVEGGRTINSRAYSAIISANVKPSSARIRTGSRVAVPAGPGSSQFQFMQVGVNIDCASARELGGQFTVDIGADISSLAPVEPGSNAPPAVRTYQWNSNAIIPVRKATIVFSSDDVASKRTMQLEVTATPIK